MSDKILIVDDHGKNIQLLANLLTDAQYEIEYALNGKTAIQWLERESFDLILLDIMMPDIDGIETCREIKKMESRQDIPIIFITARDDTESITKAFNVGGIDYLTKPFNQEELLIRIATHLELKHNREKLLDTTKWLEKEVDKKTYELQQANNKIQEAYNNLKSLDQAQNAFLKSISHEIRTPLNGISGSLSLLKSFENNEEVDEVVNLLEISVEKLEKYSFSALQIAFLRLKGLDKNNIQEININAVLKNCIKKTLDSDSTQLEFSYSSNKPGTLIQGDFDLINSAFTALLESSVIYTSTGNINVAVTELDDTVECKIDDSGSLFDDQSLTYMFDSIVHKGSHYQRNASMELHLAKIIILSHQGTIEFRNKPDLSGAVTIVYLPKTFLLS